MAEDIFKGLTSEERMKEGKELLGHFPQLNDLFDEGWLNALLQPGVETKKVLPLYWYLTNSYVNERLAKALLMLAATSPSYKKFIHELKSAKTNRELVGHIREVETYYLLRERGHDVVWRPIIKTAKGTLSPDLLINWEIPIYLEILTITDSDDYLSEQQAQTEVQIGINRMEENPFAISAHYREILSESDVVPILDFVRSEIPSINIKEGATETRTFQKEGKDFVKIDFRRIDGLRGWVSGGGPGRSIDTSSRLKNKILDKIEAFQLPQKGGGKHLNGYLIFMEPMLMGGHDVIAAIKGQHTLSFPVPMPGVETDSTPIPGHASNGVVHHGAWDDTIQANLDFIASTNSSGGKLLGSDSILMIAEGLEIKPERIQEILFEKKEN